MTQAPVTGVFLSYSHRDSETVDKLRLELEQRGIAVTVDSQSMAPGQKIQDFIQDAIRTTRTTVWVVSEESLSSGWVGVEMVASLGNAELWKEHRLIACYLDDDILKDDFRLRQHEKLSARIRELDEETRRRADAGIDTIDIDDEKARLFKLRNNLGELLKHLRGSLCLDLRPPAFAATVRTLAAKLAEPRGRRYWWLGGLALGLAMIAGLVAWLQRPSPLDTCITAAFARNGRTLAADELTFLANASTSGGLDLTTANPELAALREFPDTLSALERCRRQHASTTKSITVTITFRLASGAPVPDGTQLSVGRNSCMTKSGKCQLALASFTGAEPPKVSAALPDGTSTEKSVGAHTLVGGVSFEPLEPRPQLASTTVSVVDCQGKPRSGQVRLETAGEPITQADLRSGTAVLRYDPQKFRAAQLSYTSESGATESYPMVAAERISVQFPRVCPPQRCRGELVLRLQNEARRALPRGEEAQVSFQVKANAVQLIAAPAGVRRQLAGKSVNAADCVGQFSLRRE